MGALKGVVRLLLAVVAATMLLNSQAQAAESCHTINATGVGQDFGGGQPTGRTVADIHGGGLLHGTAEGNYALTGVTGTVASFRSIVTFTTHHGALTVSVAGTLDIATGAFSAAGPVRGATGKLAGATGRLVFEGIEDLATGRFVEDVTGEICVDLGRH